MMGLALAKEREQNGYPRKAFEARLLQIGDTARRAEQKLALKIDERIEKQYKKHEASIVEVKKTVKTIQHRKHSNTIRKWFKLKK